MHVSCLNDSDQCPQVAQGESDVQLPPIISLSQSVEPKLCLTMPTILKQQQMQIKKHLLSFSYGDTMLVALAGIAIVESKQLISSHTKLCQ